MMANRNDEALRDEVLSVVRAVEALKGECGMNPESPQAIRNGQYASISARLYCVYEALTPRPEPAGRVEEVAALVEALHVIAANWRGRKSIDGSEPYWAAEARARDGIEDCGDDLRDWLIARYPDAAHAPQEGAE